MDVSSMTDRSDRPTDPARQPGNVRASPDHEVICRGRMLHNKFNFIVIDTELILHRQMDLRKNQEFNRAY